MTSALATPLLYALLTTALYYLGARAEITRFLWSRYREGGFLDRVTWCPACSGFWYGLVVSAIGVSLKLPFLGLAGDAWYTPPLVGLASMIWTPPLAALHVWAWSSPAFAREDTPVPREEVNPPPTAPCPQCGSDAVDLYRMGHDALRFCDHFRAGGLCELSRQPVTKVSPYPAPRCASCGELHRPHEPCALPPPPRAA